jgi:hypothetical protein
MAELHGHLFDRRGDTGVRARQNSERGRGVDPQNPGFGTPGVFPAMGPGTFEIEAIAGLKTVMALILEPDLKFTAQDVEEFLAFMGIRFTAAPAGFDAKKVRFHGGVAPGKEFHADLGAGFEDLALGGTNEGLDVPIRLKHRKDIGLVETCDALERGDRRAHLAAFESTQEANGHAGGTSDL